MPAAFLDALADPAESSVIMVLVFFVTATALQPFSLATAFTAAVERAGLRGSCRWQEDGSLVVAALDTRWISGISESLELCCACRFAAAAGRVDLRVDVCSWLGAAVSVFLRRSPEAMSDPDKASVSGEES